MRVTKAEVVFMRWLRNAAVWHSKHAKSLAMWATRQYAITLMEYRKK